MMENEFLIFIARKRRFWINLLKIFNPSTTLLKVCIAMSLLNIVYLISPKKCLWLKLEFHLIALLNVPVILMKNGKIPNTLRSSPSEAMLPGSCITISLLVALYLLASLIYLLWLKTGFYLLDYANCMADTYFYGYLRKIIPKPDEVDNESLIERLDCYKAVQSFTDETFPFKKLFILIPKNGYTPTTLEKLDPRRIVKLQEVLPIRLDRAGVKGREYKASVYKIYYPNDSTKYIAVAMVGTPPLLALAEGCKEKPELKKYKPILIYLFYKKLLSKLNDFVEFKEACEVIYFDKDNQDLADYFIKKYLRSKKN